ncbi:MAG: hypothetical protein WKG06_47960 [Segetibacter sp.]
MKEVPDETINHLPMYCNDCGEDLQQAASFLKKADTSNHSTYTSKLC